MKKVFLIIFILIVAAVDIYISKQILLKTQKKQVSQKEEMKEQIIEEPIKEEKIYTVTTEENQTQLIQTPVEETEPTVEETKPEEEVETVQPEEKTPLENKTEEAPKQIPEGYMIANEYVNLRKEPNISSEVVAVIKKGSIVKIIGKKAKHWKRVLYTSKNRVYEGWVDDRFFTILEDQEVR